MILRDLKIRCINLARSPGRWASIEHLFSGYDVQRVDAIDGLDFSNGTFDELSRPCWDDEKLSELIVAGELTEGFTRYHKHYPTEYAACRSHKKALEAFLKTDEDWTIIIEDDVEPVSNLSTIDVPDGADFFSLIGTDHQGRVWAGDDGQIAWMRTFGAYAISRSAAATACDALTPSHYPVDMQISVRCFASLSKTYQVRCPKWGALDRFRAYAPKESVIRLSALSKQSTYTANGRKTWLGE